MNDVYQRAIETFGHNAQLVQTIEELSELIKEITKDLNGKGNVDRIIDEIADAEIMLVQVKKIYQLKFGITDDQISERRTFKTLRLQKMLLEQS